MSPLSEGMVLVHISPFFLPCCLIFHIFSFFLFSLHQHNYNCHIFISPLGPVCCASFILKVRRDVNDFNLLKKNEIRINKLGFIKNKKIKNIKYI